MIKQYLRKAGILAGAEILMKLKGLILMPIMTKYFGPTNYGIWSQVGIIARILSPLMVLGTGSAMMRFLPGKDHSQKQRGLTTVLLHIVVVSTFVGLILWWVSRPVAVAFLEGAKNARFITICGVGILVSLVSNVCDKWYRIEDRAKILAVRNTTWSFIGMFIVIGVTLAKGSAFELIVVNILAETLLVGIFLTHIGLRYGYGRPDFSLLKVYLRYGLPIMPAGYLMWVLNGSDRIFIIYYGTLADIGVYSVVYSLGSLFINMFFAPIWTMYPARASELYNQSKLDELNRLFRYSTRVALVMLIPIMVGFSVLAKPIFRMLTTEEFMRGAPLVPLITLGYVFHIMGSYWAVCFGLAMRPILSTINTGAAAVLNILLNALLIPRLGITGAALATTLSFALQMVLNIWRGSRYVRLHFDWLFFTKVCVASAVMAGVVSLVRPTGRLLTFSAMALGIFVYTIAILLMRALSSDEMKSLLHMLKLERLLACRFVRALLRV